jgi:hypothetical protein
MMVEKGKLTTELVSTSVELATTVARIEDARLGDVPSSALTIAHAESSADTHQQHEAHHNGSNCLMSC